MRNNAYNKERDIMLENNVVSELSMLANLTKDLTIEGFRGKYNMSQSLSETNLKGRFPSRLNGVAKCRV